MKKYLLSFLLWVAFTTTYAQLGDLLKRKAGEGARQGVASGTEKALDKGVDKLFHRNKKNTPPSDPITSAQPATPTSSVVPLSTYSKYDFVPGEKILGFDDSPQDETIPASLTFDWQVTQLTGADDDDEKPQEVTYYFTTSGDYAAVKPQDKSFSLMVYSKGGHTWMFNDKSRTIIVMSMPKVVGQGALAGKQMAEHFKKGPLKKDVDDEHLSMRKTGRTRQIAGYTADEYEMTNTTASSGKTAAASFWYAKVPFDPVKIYTMGAGRPADPDKLRNDPKMKNNFAAIPLLNVNYLWVETEAGGKIGLQTLSIKKSPVTVTTTGYTIKTFNH
jgi:hypothetical protein